MTTPATTSGTSQIGAGASNPPFERLLVANRGEIAVRISTTARAMGIHTIAVHTDVDADALHVRVADEAVALGPTTATTAYLDIDAVVAAAGRTGAQAVHPGYGFLAEHAGFARACRDAGLVFVGPSAAAIAAMGDKSVARRRMAAAGVPVLPGDHASPDGDDPDAGGAGDSARDLEAAAARIGFPVMVKASAGGGGTGLRRVAAAAALPAALAAVRREARAAFGSDHVIIERAVDDARHVEVQVLADQYGTVVALGDRDCSVQRRHQKVVEEAPAPGLGDTTREALAEAAVAAARDVDYVGAGTVEFLLAPDGSLSFLEMNTRLQVEHPVTEMVTGIDIVEWQLRVAAGERLPAAWTTPQAVTSRGHAIEARLYAEDPNDAFLPRVGTIHGWDPPAGRGVRVDTGIATGSRVTSDYDPLLAKIVVHGSDRDQARRRLATALEQLVIQGVTTNRTFLMAVVGHEAFASGAVTTTFLDDHDIAAARPDARDMAAVATWLHRARQVDAQERSPGLAGWSSRGHARTHQRLEVGGDAWDIEVTATPHGLRVGVGRPGDEATATFESDDRDAATHDDTGFAGLAVTARRPNPDRVLAHLRHVDIDATDVLQAPPASRRERGTGIVTAPMHGVIASAAVSAGDSVAVGDELVTLEAMKMEHPLRAPIEGVVTEAVAAGAQVAIDDVVVRIEPNPGDPPAAPDQAAAGSGGATERDPAPGRSDRPGDATTSLS